MLYFNQLECLSHQSGNSEVFLCLCIVLPPPNLRELTPIVQRSPTSPLFKPLQTREYPPQDVDSPTLKQRMLLEGSTEEDEVFNCGERRGQK